MLYGPFHSRLRDQRGISSLSNTVTVAEAHFGDKQSQELEEFLTKVPSRVSILHLKPRDDLHEIPTPGKREGGVRGVRDQWLTGSGFRTTPAFPKSRDGEDVLFFQNERPVAASRA